MATFTELMELPDITQLTFICLHGQTPTVHGEPSPTVKRHRSQLTCWPANASPLTARVNHKATIVGQGSVHHDALDVWPRRSKTPVGFTKG
jgi:hypothetical protein